METLRSACAADVPNFVGRMCEGSGVFNQLALNLPNICRKLNLESEIEKQLSNCKEKSVFTDVWRYRYGILNGVPSSFTRYVEDYAKKDSATIEENSVAKRANSAAPEIFNILYLFCEKDKRRIERFLGTINEDLRGELYNTPTFCDFNKSTGDDIVFDKQLAEYLIDKTSSTGFRQPVCRKYYCSIKQCESQVENNSDYFIFDHIWDKYYDVTFDWKE